MKTIILTSALCTLILSTSFAVQAEIYKWTDSNGVTHYSARPPVQKKKDIAKVKNIEEKIRFAAGKHKPSSNTSNTNSSDQKATTEQGQEQNNTQLSPPSKKLVSYCKGQRSNLSTLKNNFRNIWKDPDGKEKKLNQKERKEKINFLIKRITEDCEGV